MRTFAAFILLASLATLCLGNPVPESAKNVSHPTQVCIDQRCNKQFAMDGDQQALFDCVARCAVATEFSPLATCARLGQPCSADSQCNGDDGANDCAPTCGPFGCGYSFCQIGTGGTYPGYCNMAGFRCNPGASSGANFCGQGTDAPNCIIPPLVAYGASCSCSDALTYRCVPNIGC